MRFLLLIATLFSSMAAEAIVPNAVELEIGTLASQHPGQKRAQMVYDPVLNAVARAKARDMGVRKYYDHLDPDGYGPNRTAQLVGFVLPGHWGSGKDANYIESIDAAVTSASAAFNEWMKSAPHRAHILGEDSFYVDQTRYGVGYANVPGSPWIRYYVFISAPPPDSPPIDEPYAEWLLDHYSPKGLDTSNDASDDDGDGLSRVQEFVLVQDPKVRDRLPSPVYNRAKGRLEWRLTMRRDLGTVRAWVEQSSDLNSWSDSDVTLEDGAIFSIPALKQAGFMRFAASR